MVKLRIWSSGDKFWFLNDGWHRAHGPAIVWIDGITTWYWYDRRVSEYEHMMIVAQEQIDG